MKNKILLGSVTVLSALMLAACGNKDQKAAETTAAPTTESVQETTSVATTTDSKTSTDSSSNTKEISIADTQRMGSKKIGYVNVPKDWIEFKDGNATNQFSSKDKYNIITMNGFSKDEVELRSGETFGAELIANRTYDHFKNDKEVVQMNGKKTKFAGEEAFLINILFTDGKYYFGWIFSKGDKVYSVELEGSEDMLKTLRPLLEQSWGLDSKTPGQ